PRRAGSCAIVCRSGTASGRPGSWCPRASRAAVAPGPRRAAQDWAYRLRRRGGNVGVRDRERGGGGTSGGLGGRGGGGRGGGGVGTRGARYWGRCAGGARNGRVGGDGGGAGAVASDVHGGEGLQAAGSCLSRCSLPG